MVDTKQTGRFVRFGFATIISIYLLILVGGIVRATGSGMGCPDWPKCFGMWIPPTDVSQLPADYQEIYAHRGYASVEFNVVKTWIEYLNRLLGAMIGVFIFVSMVLSFRYFSVSRDITLVSIFAFISVAFQGWLGSLVVSSNLAPYMVSIHMAVALVIVALVIYSIGKANILMDTEKAITDLRKVSIPFLVLLILLSLVQIFLGTQVREAIDKIALGFNFSERGSWIENLGLTFYLHRSISLLILVLNLYFLRTVYKGGFSFLLVPALGLLSVIVLSIVSGAVMAYFAIPAFFQPVHLLLGSMMIGLQLYILIMVIVRKDQERVFNSVNFVTS